MNRKLMFCLAAFALPALAHAQETRGFDARDLVTLERVSSPTLSPDGRHLLLTVREVDYEANKASTGLWIENLHARDAAPPVRFTPEGFGAGSAAFAPDGSAVYFLSSKSGSSQLWKQALGKGEPVQVSDYPLPVGTFKVSPDGQAVALSFEVFTDCGTLACTKQKLDDMAATKASGVLYDGLFVRHWDSWKDGRRNQLFVAALGADGKPQAFDVRLGISDGSMTELMMAPDSSAAAALKAGAEVIVGTQSAAPRTASGPRFSF